MLLLTTLEFSVSSIHQWRGKKEKGKGNKNKLYYYMKLKRKRGKAPSLQPTVNEIISALRKRAERKMRK